MNTTTIPDSARAFVLAAELIARVREPRPGFLELLSVDRTGAYDDADRPIWQLRRPQFFYSAKWKAWIMVPAGFCTNYASVPRLPFMYWWYGDRCWEEPALHDFAYTAHAVYLVTFDDTGRIATSVLVEISRDEADELFLEALLLNTKTPDGMDHTMHQAVRLGGKGSWKAPTSIWQPPEIRELLPA